MLHILAIAGSDSSGGAGIQADLKTVSALGCYGMSAISALTAQNTRGVQAVQLCEPELLQAQIDAVFSDIRVDGVKIGMLGSQRLIEAVAEALGRWQPPLIVLDPVMLSKSGHRLLDPAAVSALKAKLLPLCSVITPNLPEAEALCDLEPGSVDSLPAMIEAGARLCGLGARAVLVKGGHMAGEADDVIVSLAGSTVLPGKRLDARHTHGTGCSLSSALTVFLARGLDLPQAAGRAKAWVAEGIAQGLAIGGGCGPIHHFHEFYTQAGERR